MAAMMVNIALPMGCAGIERLLVRYKLDSHNPKLFQAQDQLLYTPGEPVKLPDHHHIEQPAPGVCQERIKAGTPFLGTARPVGITPDKSPVALSDQIPERLFLDFKVLNEVNRVTLLGLGGGGDSSVDRHSQHEAPKLEIGEERLGGGISC
jgi:hypothetical protein